MSKLLFHYKGPVMGKPRMTRRDAWKKRPVIVRYYEYKDALREAAERAKYHPEEELDIMFSIQMPKSWSKKKKEEFYNKPHKQRPDVDNLVKAYLDILLEEDSHVWHINATKYWGHENEIFIFENEK